MKRLAILVGAPLNDEKSAFHRGVMTDINNYCSYFQSPTGGGFLENEIIYLENPTTARLMNTLRANPADFIVFVYSVDIPLKLTT